MAYYFLGLSPKQLRSWGEPLHQDRCFPLIPTPLVAIVYFGFSIQERQYQQQDLARLKKGSCSASYFWIISVSTYFNFIVPHYLTRRNQSLVLFPLRVFHPRWLTSRTGPLLAHFSIDRSHCQRNIFLKFINQRTVIYIWSPVVHHQRLNRRCENMADSIDVNIHHCGRY